MARDGDHPNAGISAAVPASNNADQTRGKPFEAGNNFGKGRTAGSRNKATLILDAIADEEAEAVLKATLEKAKAGDLRAADIILSRVWSPRKGRPTTFDLPKIETPQDVLNALASVIDAAATGEITPDEAAVIAGLLETKRKAIETVEIEARLSELERKTQ